MNIAVFASGGGSNLQAIIDGCASGKIAARVCVVISNNSGSGALERAKAAGIPAVHLSAVRLAHSQNCESISDAAHSPESDSSSLANEMLETLRAHQTDIVFLAGYLKKIPDEVLAAFENRIFNIHPSLLPKFGGRGMYGINVHTAVIAANEPETGITIHRVTAEYDVGDILAQRKVPVLPGDTPQALAARVLEQEHIFLVEFLNEFK